jgi:hypothetical protein
MKLSKETAVLSLDLGDQLGPLVKSQASKDVR